MIEVEHLTRRFGDHIAVNDLSFTAEKGTIYGFLGPNGAGKSTTMNMMTGYLAPSSGTVKIDGFDILKQPEDAKKRIGYLPEIPPVYPDMTVKEYLFFAAELKEVPKADRAAAVENAMQKTGTKGMQDRLIKNLSKGYKQRVGLAQAIINDPEIIILDEPTVGLDPEQQKEMFDYVRTLREDHIIILSSHILSDVSSLCDYVWIISKGQLVASDKPENLRTAMSHKQEIIIDVLGDNEQALGDALRRIDLVSGVNVSVAKDPGKGAPLQLHAVIHSEQDLDVRPAISQAVFGAGMYFLSMNRSERSLEDVFLSLTNDDSPRSSGENAKTGKKTAETAPAESRTDSKQTEASQPNSDNVNSEHDDSDRKASEHMASEHKEVSD
ncbi:MAG: ABC transporter ATP-binding protein [Lachnospiraceae bacterium]|nr:ABC transporter ATP-binding protein [Lachnospiraceae bacterium]